MKLFTDEQLKAHYTQPQLVDLVQRKAAIANRQSMLDNNPGYKRYNKDMLVMMIRDLDESMKNGGN